MADIPVKRFLKNFMQLAAVFVVIQVALVYFVESETVVQEDPEENPFIRQKHMERPSFRALRGSPSSDLAQDSTSSYGEGIVQGGDAGVAHHQISIDSPEVHARNQSVQGKGSGDLHPAPLHLISHSNNSIKAEPPNDVSQNTSSSTHAHPLLPAVVASDDDGEALVRELLSEIPVEEKGEREEWASHQGWHRKEDVHGKSDQQHELHKKGPATVAPSLPSEPHLKKVQDSSGGEELPPPHDTSKDTRDSAGLVTQTRPSFLCADGTGVPLPLSLVNDGYCDCTDGSDENMTSGCAGLEARAAVQGLSHRSNREATQGGMLSTSERSEGNHLVSLLPVAAAAAAGRGGSGGGGGGMFLCGELLPGVKGKEIFSSRVGDGVCDCCDGSDENNNRLASSSSSSSEHTEDGALRDSSQKGGENEKVCPDTCAEVRAEAAVQRQRFNKGAARRRSFYLGKAPREGVRQPAEQTGGGSDNAFFALASGGTSNAACLTTSWDKEFRYELCLFGTVKQFERKKKSSSGTLLGARWDWVENNRHLHVTGGEGGCPGANKERRADVFFECAEEGDAIVRAEELETCSYEFLVTTPAACV
jgi:hypothetical protein